jgi:hypothetical protein
MLPEGHLSGNKCVIENCVRTSSVGFCFVSSSCISTQEVYGTGTWYARWGLPLSMNPPVSLVGHVVDPHDDAFSFFPFFLLG